MSDNLTPEQRRRCMSAVRGKDTKPELFVRSLAHRLGYRFRLHRLDLPGKPDLVFFARRKVVFVHGCFWHQHPNCPHGNLPHTRRRFWLDKLTANRKRDQRVQRQLRAMGWGLMVVWECQLQDLDRLAQRLVRFLS